MKPLWNLLGWFELDQSSRLCKKLRWKLAGAWYISRKTLSRYSIDYFLRECRKTYRPSQCLIKRETENWKSRRYNLSQFAKHYFAFQSLLYVCTSIPLFPCYSNSASCQIATFANFSAKPWKLCYFVLFLSTSLSVSSTEITCADSSSDPIYLAAAYICGRV